MLDLFKKIPTWLVFTLLTLIVIALALPAVGGFFSQSHPLPVKIGRQILSPSDLQREIRWTHDQWSHIHPNIPPPPSLGDDVIRQLKYQILLSQDAQSYGFSISNETLVQVMQRQLPLIQSKAQYQRWLSNMALTETQILSKVRDGLLAEQVAHAIRLGDRPYPSEIKKTCADYETYLKIQYKISQTKPIDPRHISLKTIQQEARRLPALDQYHCVMISKKTIQPSLSDMHQYYKEHMVDFLDHQKRVLPFKTCQDQIHRILTDQKTLEHFKKNQEQAMRTPAADWPKKLNHHFNTLRVFQNQPLPRSSALYPDFKALWKHIPSSLKSMLLKPGDRSQVFYQWLPNGAWMMIEKYSVPFEQAIKDPQWKPVLQTYVAQLLQADQSKKKALHWIQDSFKSIQPQSTILYRRHNLKGWMLDALSRQKTGFYTFSEPQTGSCVAYRVVAIQHPPVCSHLDETVRQIMQEDRAYLQYAAWVIEASE